MKKKSGGVDPLNQGADLELLKDGAHRHPFEEDHHHQNAIELQHSKIYTLK